MKTMQKILFVSFTGLLFTLALIGIQNAWSSDVRILSSTGFLDELGYYEVFGEVQNIGSQSLQSVKVIATFYNETHIVVGTNFAFTILDVLPPQTKSPFQIVLLNKDASARTASFSLAVTSLRFAGLKPPGLRILSNSSYVDEVGYYEIVGEVQNTKAQSTSYVKIVAAFYSENGNVIGCGFAFSDPSDLMPSQTAPFHIVFLYKNLVPLIRGYSLTCESQEYSDVVPELRASLLLTFTGLASITIITLRKKRNMAHMRVPKMVKNARAIN